MNTTRTGWVSGRVDTVAQYVTVGFVGTQAVHFVEDGVPLLRGQNIKPFRIDLTNLKFIDHRTHLKWAKSSLAAGDVIIVRVGYPGTAAVVPEGLGDLNAASVVIVRPDIGKLDPHYFANVLNSPWGRASVAGRFVGSAQQVLNAGAVAALEIPLPPINVQRKIASVLSAYDELIENNARRIEILEEMAQAIYREWFVEFRYPGHEGVPLVDSELGPIPEGWGVTTVDAAFEISGGGTPSKTVTEYWENGDIDWYTPTDLTATRSMFMSESKSKITRLGLKKSSAKLFPAGSVMMTSRATIGVVSISETEASTNQGFITCIPNDRYSALFIVQWLRASADVIDSLASGATFKEINKKNFREIKLVAPSEIALSEFQKIVAPICDSIAVLLKSNRNLRETRDLLLPKLISGEIDVSDLDIELADSVA